MRVNVLGKKKLGIPQKKNRFVMYTRTFDDNVSFTMLKCYS